VGQKIWTSDVTDHNVLYVDAEIVGGSVAKDFAKIVGRTTTQQNRIIVDVLRPNMDTSLDP
jgi:hypothetical protein